MGKHHTNITVSKTLLGEEKLAQRVWWDTFYKYYVFLKGWGKVYTRGLFLQAYRKSLSVAGLDSWTARSWAGGLCGGEGRQTTGNVLKPSAVRVGCGDREGRKSRLMVKESRKGKDEGRRQRWMELGGQDQSKPRMKAAGMS